MAEKSKGMEATSNRPAQEGQTASAPEANVSKIEAVRRAVRALGAKADRDKIQMYIQDHFGLDISVNHISNYKGKVLRKSKEQKSRKAQTPQPVEAKAAPEASTPAKKSSGAGNGKESVMVEDILAVKRLVERVGSDQLRVLVEALSK